VRKKCSQVSGFRYDGPRRRAEADAKLFCQNLRKRRFSESWRPGKKNMVERIAASARRLNENTEIGARLFLSDEFVERLREDRSISPDHVLSAHTTKPPGVG